MHRHYPRLMAEALSAPAHPAEVEVDGRRADNAGVDGQRYCQRLRDVPSELEKTRASDLLAKIEAEMPWSEHWECRNCRRDRWKCGEQQTPPSQTLWRWCPCRRRRRRRGRDVPQRCWRCHLIQRRNALHHLDSCGARYCLVIIEPSALQQTSPDIHAAMMLELPLPPRVAQMPSHTSPDY